MQLAKPAYPAGAPTWLLNLNLNLNLNLIQTFYNNPQNSKSMYHSFTEMPVWQKANKLAIEIFHMTIPLPRSEDYGLTSQIRKSSNSVGANIAEGFGRSKPNDKAFFYVVARGSSFETQHHLIYGQQVGYFEESRAAELHEKYNELIFEINSLIKAVERR